METSKKDYPQFSGGAAAICEERITNTIDDFRLAPAVQNRLREIETVETTDSGIMVTFKVQAKQIAEGAAGGETKSLPFSSILLLTMPEGGRFMTR